MVQWPFARQRNFWVVSRALGAGYGFINRKNSDPSPIGRVALLRPSESGMSVQTGWASEDVRWSLRPVAPSQDKLIV